MQNANKTHFAFGVLCFAAAIVSVDPGPSTSGALNMLIEPIGTIEQNLPLAISEGAF